ncbi:MAG: hypothetical protein AAGE52_25920 [Myxococcota bacterium]
MRGAFFAAEDVGEQLTPCGGDAPEGGQRDKLEDVLRRLRSLRDTDEDEIDLLGEAAELIEELVRYSERTAIEGRRVLEGQPANCLRDQLVAALDVHTERDRTRAVLLEQEEEADEFGLAEDYESRLRVLAALETALHNPESVASPLGENEELNQRVRAIVDRCDSPTGVRFED